MSTKPSVDSKASDLVLADEDLKLLFSLFTSTTEHERRQVLDPGSPHFYREVDLSEEYELTAEKREYALDAWRSVLLLLHAKGYRLESDGRMIDLRWFAETCATSAGGSTLFTWE